jgi:putative oxidoreductase
MSVLPNSWFIARHAAAAAHPVRSRISRSGAVARLRALETRCDVWLVTYSIAILRVSVGAVFLVFGLLKFFPGVSPAQGLVEKTTGVLTLGLVPGSVALAFVATLESIIGLCLIANRRVRLAVYLLVFELIGILSPLVLLPGRMFHGPHGAPTLEGQYVLKDLIVVGAALVLATSVRGARFASEPEECDVPSTATPGVGRGTGVSSGSQIHEWSHVSRPPPRTHR